MLTICLNQMKPEESGVGYPQGTLFFHGERVFSRLVNREETSHGLHYNFSYQISLSK